jgi:hypothetical protein
MANAYFPGVELSDPLLMEQLLAAEAQLQRDLRCSFTPRLVVPDTATPEQVAAIQEANPTTAITTEPGYDYDPRLFAGEAWGLIQLRALPVIQVNSISFNYPRATDVAYTIPQDWIRPDLKRGIINLQPVQTSSALPLNIWFLRVLGGGSLTSFIMQISYVHGLANARQDFPDLLNLIKRQAVLNILETAFIPQSDSTSVDGLSGNISMETGKYQVEIDKKVARLYDAIHGIRCAVL